MKNKKILIFQTVVRKYVGIHDLSKSGYFFRFYPQISVKKTKKNLDKKCGKFSYCFDFFQIFTISKMKTRTQIFPEINKNDFMRLKHI
jgi:hypothetical protein